MPNGDFHDLSEREILVKVATQMGYVEKQINSTNMLLEKHVEALRKTVNDCNATHCGEERNINKRIEGIEKRQIQFLSTITVLGTMLLFLKDAILNFVFGR